MYSLEPNHGETEQVYGKAGTYDTEHDEKNRSIGPLEYPWPVTLYERSQPEKCETPTPRKQGDARSGSRPVGPQIKHAPFPLHGPHPRPPPTDVVSPPPNRRPRHGSREPFSNSHS